MSGGAELLVDALAGMRRDCPRAHDRLRDALSGRALEIDLDGEPTWLLVDSAIEPRSTIAVRTRLATTRALLEDRLDVLDALAGGELDVVGSPDDVLACGDGARWFLEGLLRCRDARRLFERLVVLTEVIDG